MTTIEHVHNIARDFARENAAAGVFVEELADGPVLYTPDRCYLFLFTWRVERYILGRAEAARMYDATPTP